MTWTSASPILIWAVIIIPITVLLWLRQPNNKLTTILVILDYALFNLFFILCVNWAVVNYWLRLFPVIMTLAILIHLLRVKFSGIPFLPKKSILNGILLLFSLLFLIPAGYMDFRVIQSFNYNSYPGKPLLLWFPVRNGTYVIANGGNGLNGIGLNNYYRDWLGRETGGDKRLIYAVDIVKMTLTGNISSGILPHSFLKYGGFDDMVYSPCQGEVVYVEDGHPNIQPFSQGTSFLGNYVVIQCQEAYVTLGGFRDGKMAVKIGDKVRARTLIGYMGSSGSPSIPHLHVHATEGGWKDGEGTAVPMLFDGVLLFNQFATRNQIFIP
jgi:hypothetical protein